MIIGAEGEERKKVVARQRRNERACKRIADASEAFYEKEEQRYKRTLIFAKKNQSKRYKACSDVELVTRLELATCALRMRCSTD